jgi:hypothetical protein
MHAPLQPAYFGACRTHASAPHHYPAATCLSESATSALALPRVMLPKKKKKKFFFDPDPIFSARSNGLEPDLLKWVRPSIGPRVSVF